MVSSLLRTGNSADTATDGLPWDRYLYRMQPADLLPLGALGTVDLVFTAGNDADALPTNFWIDGVRLCVSPTPVPLFLCRCFSGRSDGKTLGTASHGRPVSSS